MEHELTDRFVQENLMGPSVSRLFGELCSGCLPQNPEARICDLGCGSGLSSLLVARECAGKIDAVDAWNEAADNQALFDRFGLGGRIRAVKAEAPALPFEERAFDALICLDSYHYFGRSEGFIDEISRYVKPTGSILLAFPGLTGELDAEGARLFGDAWGEESLACFQTIAWWRALLSSSSAVQGEEIAEMACFREAWDEWLACDNDYARADRAVMEEGGFERMNLIKVRLRVR